MNSLYLENAERLGEAVLVRLLMRREAALADIEAAKDPEWADVNVCEETARETLAEFDAEHPEIARLYEAMGAPKSSMVAIGSVWDGSAREPYTAVYVNGLRVAAFHREADALIYVAQQYHLPPDSVGRKP